MSVIDHFVHVDRIYFDAYNEGGDLPAQVEAYKKRTGKYPESLLADKIYRTRENYRYCHDLEIHLAGPKLGRPYQEGTLKSRIQRRTQRQDEIERVEIEGKFGVMKRRFTWDLIKARLVDTSEAWILIAIIVANLNQGYRYVLPGAIVIFCALSCSHKRKDVESISYANIHQRVEFCVIQRDLTIVQQALS